MRVCNEDLRTSAVDILTFLGESPAGAERTADCLVSADMRGISTHGTYLLKTISERVKAGMLILPTKPEFIKNEGAVALIDGKNGLGPIAARLAIETCIEKAKKFGTSTIFIRNTNNVGSLAYYTQLAAKQNMIAIMGCNAAPSMAPWGGAEAFVGTNPIAIAIPAGEGLCFSADMASSVVARGKIRRAVRQNSKIPDNWAIDKNGKQTNDPVEALKGTVLPMGGPKGSALALAIDIISGVVSGSSYAQNIKSFHTLDGKTGVGAFCITIDVSRFMGIDEFENLMRNYITAAKNIKKAEGFNEIFMPGEIETEKEKKSLENGIDLDSQTIVALNNLLDKIGSQTRL